MSYLNVKKSFQKPLLAAIALALLPSFTFAEDITDLKSLITYVMSILNSLIPLLFAVAFIAFVWGIIKYLYAGGPKEMTEARNYLIFGIIAMAVMMSVFGLATLVKDSFFASSPSPVNVNDSNNPLLNNVNTSPGGGNYNPGSND